MEAKYLPTHPYRPRPFLGAPGKVSVTVEKRTRTARNSSERFLLLGRHHRLPSIHPYHLSKLMTYYIHSVISSLSPSFDDGDSGTLTTPRVKQIVHDKSQNPPEISLATFIINGRSDRVGRSVGSLCEKIKVPLAKVYP